MSGARWCLLRLLRGCEVLWTWFGEMDWYGRTSLRAGALPPLSLACTHGTFTLVLRLASEPFAPIPVSYIGALRSGQKTPHSPYTTSHYDRSYHTLVYLNNLPSLLPLLPPRTTITYPPSTYSTHLHHHALLPPSSSFLLLPPFPFPFYSRSYGHRPRTCRPSLGSSIYRPPIR